MSAHEARRAARSAAILGAMQVGDRIPFCIVEDEFRIGEVPSPVTADTLVGMLWVQDNDRVVLLVGSQEQRLLFALAVWLMAWLPVHPELMPLEYAITALRQAA